VAYTRFRQTNTLYRCSSLVVARGEYVDRGEVEHLPGETRGLKGTFLGDWCGA
jgi:hypothetical protein